MASFHYLAIDKQGREQKGVIEADGVKHARQLLRDQLLLPIEVNAIQQKHSLSPNRIFQQNTASYALSSARLSLMTRQLATLLSAGLPLEESLTAVAEQSETARVKGLVLSVRAKVMEGHTFAAALRNHPDSFSALFCATIAAGEKSGHLDKVLLRLADYTEQQAHLRQKLKTALIYPGMIMLVAIGIVGFLLEYVVPKMISVYGDMHQALPWMTSLLINISNGVKRYGIWVVLCLIVIIYVFVKAMRKSPRFKDTIHRLLLRLPVFGYALKTADTARFSRTLSILSAAGVSVLDAMTISAQLIVMLPIRKAVQNAVHQVREGRMIHIALKQTHYFSPMSIHMMASGEASGQLENMLERVAKTQEDEILRLIEVGLALFEPIMILVMGAVILFIVLAVLLPIFQLNQLTG